MAKAVFEFCIKKDILNSGEVVLTPVCRRKQNRFIFFYQNPWDRITKVYDKYILMDLDFDPGLTHTECEQHIDGYKAQLLKAIESRVQSAEFHDLEEVTI